MNQPEVSKIDLRIPSSADTLAQLARLTEGLEPEENTRAFFSKLLPRCARLLGARRLLILEGRMTGRDPVLLAWHGVRPGPSDRVWVEVAKRALENGQPFFPDSNFYASLNLESPKTTLAGMAISAYDQTLAALVAALPSPTDPQLLTLIAGQIGLQLYNRQANIRAAGLAARAHHNQLLLSSLWENMPVAALRVEGQLLRPNPLAAELLGIADPETNKPILLTDLTLFQPDGVTSYPSEDVPLNLSEPVNNVAVALPRPDGQLVPLLLTISPVLAEDGRLVGGFIFLQPHPKNKSQLTP